MLSAFNSGTWDLVAQTGLTMQTLVPSASITAVGFAFANYQEVWNAVDGRLGRYIIESFRKAKLIAFEKMWNNGFRQTTSSSNPIKTPYDVTNQKIRVPDSGRRSSSRLALSLPQSRGMKRIQLSSGNLQTVSIVRWPEYILVRCTKYRSMYLALTIFGVAFGCGQISAASRLCQHSTNLSLLRISTKQR